MTDVLIPLDARALSQIRCISIPDYHRAALRAGIAHFGVGNFHRAHQAVYLDRYASKTGDVGWGIVGIGVSDGDAAREKAESFAAQDHLYTVTEFDPAGNPSVRVNGAIIGYLVAPREPERVLDLLASPHLHIVSLTLTEGGYDGSGIVFELIAAALQRRRKAGIPPFTVVSCDNVHHNGAITRRAVLDAAARTDGDLATWIDNVGAFPNSMVDRVVPYVSASKRAELNGYAGIDDALAVAGESYLQWVIEDDFADARPALEEVGVQIVDDVTAYETAKLRMLNAPHVLLSYPALLAGYRLVDQAIADPVLRGLLERFVDEDVIPFLERVPEDLDTHAYTRGIFERFGNPAIGDQLSRIATDGHSKIPTFHAAIASRLAAGGRNVGRELLLMACFRRHLAGVDDHGKRFPVSEPTLPESIRSELLEDPLAVLRLDAFQSLGLADDPRIVTQLIEVEHAIATWGVIAAIERLAL